MGKRELAIAAVLGGLVFAGQAQSAPEREQGDIWLRGGATQVFPKADNNDIVDAIALRYYNEFHPFCLLVNVDDRDRAVEDRAFFDDAENVRHYSSAPFYYQTVALHDRTVVHQRQIAQYQSIRDSLDGLLREYAQSLLRKGQLEN